MEKKQILIGHYIIREVNKSAYVIYTKYANGDLSYVATRTTLSNARAYIKNI